LPKSAFGNSIIALWDPARTNRIVAGQTRDESEQMLRLQGGEGMPEDTREPDQAAQSNAPTLAEPRQVEMSNHIHLIYDIAARRVGKKDSVQPAVRCDVLGGRETQGE
jgi:hypothetical protein